ncbi:MAG TPA: radical SAM protein [Phycisphaerales bacterium]|nr:radical SAM protein [Phycisphaerales bacterium]
MAFDINKHPCFNGDVCGQFGRVHLPVAAECNVQCNFCDRKFDCVNESRPGVTSQVLSPGQALYYLDKVMANDKRITVVGIAGPGDPFATPGETLQTLSLVRKKYPEILFCVASNGLNIASYIEDLAALKVSHVSITISAVDPAIGEKIYAWVRDDKRVLRTQKGAEIILERQLGAVGDLKAAGITVKVNTIIIPGINDGHITQVAKTVAELGADIQNCIALYPVAGTVLGDTQPPSAELLSQIRTEASRYIRQMYHCSRCRADAVGLLSETISDGSLDCLKNAAAQPLEPCENRPCVAVASREGVLVNQHLGEADRLMVFRWEDGKSEFVEDRKTPPRGGGDSRWLGLAEVLKDCRAVLVSGAGRSPRTVLKQEGIKTILAEGPVEENLEAVYQGRQIHSPAKCTQCSCQCDQDGGGGGGCG